MISFHGRICAPIDSCQRKQGHLRAAASRRTNDRLQKPDAEISLVMEVLEYKLVALREERRRQLGLRGL